MMNTMNPTATGQSVDQSQANEQLRKAIIAKKEAQVDAWSKQIETLQEGLKDAAENVREATQKRLDDLTAARDRARDQLNQLQQATQESWNTLLQQSDEVFQDLAQRFHAFTQEQS